MSLKELCVFIFPPGTRFAHWTVHLDSQGAQTAGGSGGNAAPGGRARRRGVEPRAAAAAAATEVKGEAIKRCE